MGETPLPELQWVVLAPRDPWGTAVEFTCGPFVHSAYPQYQADCRLSLRLLQANAIADWHIVAGSDQTRVSARDASASVTAGSRARGSVILGLQATFVPPADHQLCAGEYVTRVIGLIHGL